LQTVSTKSNYTSNAVYQMVTLSMTLSDPNHPGVTKKQKGVEKGVEKQLG